MKLRRGRLLPENAAELEQVLGIRRTVPVAPTRADVERLTRKRLGSGWGKAKRK